MFEFRGTRLFDAEIEIEIELSLKIVYSQHPISHAIYGDQLLESRTVTHIGYERQLSEKLRQQQKESEEDSKWLQEEETNLKKRLSCISAVAAGELLPRERKFSVTINFQEAANT